MKFDRTLMLVLLLPVMGCAGGDDTMDSPLSDESDGGTSETATTIDAGDGQDAVPTFADVYPLIATGCGGGKSGCHVAGASGGLEMPDADVAYAHLVDVASMKCGGQMRVASGDADASLLVQALEGTSACVKPMPLGRDPMGAGDIAVIRAWIEGGAAER